MAVMIMCLIVYQAVDSCAINSNYNGPSPSAHLSLLKNVLNLRTIHVVITYFFKQDPYCRQ